MPLNNPGNQPHVVKPKPKKPALTTCGLAYSFYCQCRSFTIVFGEDLAGLDRNEAKCSGCGLVHKLDVAHALPGSPPSPELKRAKDGYVPRAQILGTDVGGM